MTRIVLSVLLVLGYSIGGLAPLGASCTGPSIVHDTGKFSAGDQLDIEGFAFGTDCHDTGAPPEGQGVLGTPASGIEVLLVQGNLVIPVASGDADLNYEFAVSITVPSDLARGDFSVIASSVRGGDAWNQTDGSVTFVDSDVVSPAVVADFEEALLPVPQPGAGAPERPEPESDPDLATLAIAGIGVLIALGAAAAVAIRAAKR